MSNTFKNERRLTGYRGDTAVQHQSYYDNDNEHYNPNLQMSDDEEDIYQDYDDDFHEINQEEGDEDEEEDDSGSELSIPDPNIDFAMVYALHTFAATVEGQASVVRGDALTLLDDSNSYWWLIKVLNTSVVGYIPAENIETPYERLARLNSHRNVELTRKDIQDAFPIPPSTKPKQTKRVTLAKGVQFQSQIIYGSSDDEDDFQAEFEQWNERMNSDESETDDLDSDDDPYQYYEESQHYDENPVEISCSPTQMDMDDYTKSTVPDEEPIDYYSSRRYSDQSDSIQEQNRESFKINEETIKISLTPSIARDNTDNNVQTSLKKSAELDRILSDLPEKKEKEKFGIRKLFSRGSSKKKSVESLERQPSNGSSYYESGSISSQSTNIHERESLDSTIQPTQIKVYADNVTEFGNERYKYATVYPSTTALELIHQLIQLEQNNEQLVDDNAYHDFYLIVKTPAGEDFTLVPSDKPLEIFQSLLAPLNTPMPSLKKARRISQLMGSETSIIGDPSEKRPVSLEEQIQFYLFSKTKRVEDGEIQVKVSLLSPNRVDKLVKVSATILVQDALTLWLEKFHILNGISAGSSTEVKSLRLDGDDELVKYGLVMSNQGKEHLLDLNDKLLDAFGEHPPPIQYRRSSNPDRLSISMNISPPSTDELFFILKPQDLPKTRRLVRQNTPMPRSMPSQQQTPAAPMPSHSTTPEDTLTPLTPSPTPRPESVYFCNDFGMNDLMVIIRGAARAEKQVNHGIRAEISQVFKDNQTRLDQLEKELDRIMSEAVNSHQ